MSLIFEYKNTIQSVYEYFIQYISDISFFDCDHVYITNDIETDVFLFFDKLDNNIAKDANGLTILPNEIVEDLIVLINIPSKLSVINIDTIIHEFTHVYDIHQFAHEYTKDNLEIIENHNLYLTYRHWCEFKANAYGEIHSCRYCDKSFNTNNTDILMNTYPENCREFVERTRQKGISHLFDGYQLYKFLGMFYMYDIYNEINDVDDSCIYEYFHSIFPPSILNHMYSLYRLYFDSDCHNSVFQNLERMKKIEYQIKCLI